MLVLVALMIAAFFLVKGVHFVSIEGDRIADSIFVETFMTCLAVLAYIFLPSIIVKFLCVLPCLALNGTQLMTYPN